MTSNVTLFGDLVHPTPIDAAQMLRHLQMLHGSGEGMGDVVLSFLSPHEPARQYGVDADFSDMSGADAMVQPIVDAGFGAYVSVNRFQKDRSAGQNSRHKRDVSVVTGVVADLDVKLGALQSTAEVDQLLSVVPSPTLVVGSGSGGAHAYWLFDQPNGDTARAQKLARGWLSCVQETARTLFERPVKLDSVADLSRVLRLAGTWRHPKQGEMLPVQPVVLRWVDGPRYTIDQIEQMIPASSMVAPVARSVTGGNASDADATWITNLIAKTVEELSQAPSGYRNAALNRAAFTLGGLGAHGFLPAEDAYERLVSGACGRNGLLFDDGEDTCRATFQSGWESGLMEPLQIPEKPSERAAPGDVWPPPTAPMDTARRLLSMWSPYVRHWRGEWHRHITDRHRWEPAEDAAVRSAVYLALDNVRYENASGALLPWAPNTTRVNQVIDAMAALLHLSQGVNQPSWLVHRDVKAEDLIVCEDGPINMHTREQYQHDAWLFNRVTTAASYDANATHHTWSAFLEQLWPDDTDQERLLAEWFGYIISGETKAQKCALIVGPPRSGKGTIANVLTALMGGSDEVAACSLSSLTQTFGLQPLLGRSLCTVGDARISGDTKPQVEQLLTISGGDVVTVHRKHKPSISIRMPTRFMLLSNELPVFSDPSGALASRFVIMKMAQSFLGREDVDLSSRLSGELSGILRWSLDGLDRLRGNGWRFTVPLSSQQALQDMADASSPVSVFVREKCKLGWELSVSKDDLYAAWRQWAESNGQRALSKIGFGRNLSAAFSEIGRYQPRNDDGSRENLWRGVGLTMPSASVLAQLWQGNGTGQTRD